jgi:N-acetylglucosamine kinase-like BadF-type ATPase
MSNQIMERNLGLLGVTAEHARAQLLSHRTALPRQFVVGVDGGGTSTRAAILDDRQRVISQSDGGPSNPLRVGIAKSTSTIRETVDKACSDVGMQRTDIRAAVVGLAGVRRADIRTRTREALEHSLGIDNLELVTDGDIALFGATGGRPGLVVIAGTGSICCGMNSQRKRVCAGGWGPIAGDEGGGAWIARKALQAIAHAADGRGPKTTLTRAACDYFRVATPEDLSTAIYAPTMSNDHLAAFGKLVVRAALDGDEVASAIITEAGAELAVAASAVIRKLRMEQEVFPVACVGGVFTAGELIKAQLRRGILRVARKAYLANPVYPPAIAAARMARSLLSGELAIAV